MEGERNLGRDVSREEGINGGRGTEGGRDKWRQKSISVGREG